MERLEEQRVTKAAEHDVAESLRHCVNFSSDKAGKPDDAKAGLPTTEKAGDTSIALPGLALVEKSGLLPDSSSRKLTAEDLSQLKNPQDFGIARNEIYARHGREFSTPFYKDYFSQQPWYKPDSANYKDSDLSTTEERNIGFLHIAELDKNLNGQRDNFRENSQAKDDLNGSVIPDSSHKALDIDEVDRLSPGDLRTAVNEIFARNGRPFQDEGWKNYFSQFDWYQPRTDFQDSDLSWMEQRNIEVLHLAEQDSRLASKPSQMSR